ncbi:MAG: ferredoxin [Rhodobacteraceae bacterium]|nr:ferredoxin [Paracoccaceae bacterium]
MGALHPARCGAKQLDGGTLLLLGAGPGFWPVFSKAREYQDRLPNPIDRWSTRVVGALATQFKSTAFYPFGGPPYAPFIDWAEKSGSTFVSPIGMLVHDTIGLMISYRGALSFEQEFPFPAPVSQSPCISCVDQPCKSRCPVSALSSDRDYNVPACREFLDSDAGKPCMTQGCAARLACPVSAGAGRTAAQSTHHMKAFHPK